MSASTNRAIALNHGRITSPAPVCLPGEKPGNPKTLAARAFLPAGWPA